VRGVVLRYDPELEAAFVAGDLERRRFSPTPWPVLPGALGSASPAEARVFRLSEVTFLARGAPLDPVPGGVLKPNEDLLKLLETETECVLLVGAARLGLAFPPSGSDRPPGLTIPAVTVVDRDAEPTLLVRHPVDAFAETLRRGLFPMNLATTAVLGIDTTSLRLALERSPGGVALADAIGTAVERALDAGVAPVRLFDPDAVAQASDADIELIDRSALAAAVERRLAGRSEGGG
jgi:hypothetical protein